MFQMKHSTTEAMATLLIKSTNASNSDPPLPFRAFTKVLKDIAQQDNITKKGLLKAKPFTAYFEDNAINSVTRKLDYHTTQR